MTVLKAVEPLVFTFDGVAYGADCKYEQVEVPAPTYLLPKALVNLVTEYIDEVEYPGAMNILWQLFGKDVVDAAIGAHKDVLTLHDDHSKSLYDELNRHYRTKQDFVSTSLVNWKPPQSAFTQECLDIIQAYVKSGYGGAGQYLYNIRYTKTTFDQKMVDRRPDDFKSGWKTISSMSAATPEWLLREDHLPLLSMEGLSFHPKCEEILRQGARECKLSGAHGLIDKFCMTPGVRGDNLSDAFFDISDSTRALLPKVLDTARISGAFFDEFFARPGNESFLPSCKILRNRHVGVPLIKRFFDAMSEESKLEVKHHLLDNESLDDTFYTEYPDIFSTKEIIATGRASGKFLYEHRDVISLRYVLNTSRNFALWLKSRTLFEELYRTTTTMVKVSRSPDTTSDKRPHQSTPLSDDRSSKKHRVQR